MRGPPPAATHARRQERSNDGRSGRRGRRAHRAPTETEDRERRSFAGSIRVRGTEVCEVARRIHHPCRHLSEVLPWAATSKCAESRLSRILIDEELKLTPRAGTPNIISIFTPERPHATRPFPFVDTHRRLYFA